MASSLTVIWRYSCLRLCICCLWPAESTSACAARALSCTRLAAVAVSCSTAWRSLSCTGVHHHERCLLTTSACPFWALNSPYWRFLIGLHDVRGCTFGHRLMDDPERHLRGGDLGLEAVPRIADRLQRAREPRDRLLGAGEALADLLPLAARALQLLPEFLRLCSGLCQLLGCGVAPCMRPRTPWVTCLSG